MPSPVPAARSLATARPRIVNASADTRPGRAPATDAVTLIVIALSLVYAVVRYVLGKGVSVNQVPLYIANKAAALAGLLLFCAALRSRTAVARATFGQRSLFLVIVHVLITIVLLDPGYYAKLYLPDGRFTGLGGTALLCGILGLVYMLRIFLAYALGARGPAPAAGRVRARTMVLVLGGAHVALLGFGGWLTPARWPLGMPPMTLLAACAVVGVGLGPGAYRAARRVTAVAAAAAERKPVGATRRASGRDLTEECAS